jgi:hypothetical protein
MLKLIFFSPENPERGCEQRDMLALLGCKYVSTGSRPLLRKRELPKRTVLSTDVGMKI